MTALILTRQSWLLNTKTASDNKHCYHIIGKSVIILG